ncbi:DeoR family transcriptional regulator [Methanogenium cariaci]|uniref:DeoR family transcriptional regulator n=1 Tax=Methanogenium cariaci TaxID=2197 RepID=UPI0007840E91|nr:DeoR family transcriptional regulator [Methanogenium cariaci]
MMEHREQYFTIREISETHDVVYQTARTDLLDLAGKGYIRKEKRGREFMFIFNEDCNLENETQ